MLARAILAFLALPGVVAFVIPLYIARGRTQPFHLVGALPLAVGIVLLLWCVRDFYVTGKGTLAPWSPPRRLVEVGLYRYSRNPMYVAVLTILIGWALAYQLRALWMYVALMLVVFHLRVVLFEEPWLARTHGDAFTQYRSRVRRWI